MSGHVFDSKNQETCSDQLKNKLVLRRLILTSTVTTYGQTPEQRVSWGGALRLELCRAHLARPIHARALAAARLQATLDQRGCDAVAGALSLLGQHPNPVQTGVALRHHH